MRPPPIRTSDPGSFARDTLARRVPAILDDTRARLRPLPAEIEARFAALDEELRHGRLRRLEEEAPDRTAWDRAVAPHAGRTWLDVPWYFAEAYFYRRVLEATGYFGRGPLGGRDPWAAQKGDEWRPEEAPRRCVETLRAAPPGGDARRRALLLGSLWGNRADLSYNVAQHLGAHVGGDDDLLADDLPAVVRHLAGARRAAIVADNAGTELLMDLALARELLVGPPALDVLTLHLKPHPFFVSDAMPKDVDDALASLDRHGAPEGCALAADLRRLRETGRLRLETHPFYTSSAFYADLPPELRAALGAEDLVICKGDANYRRLCGDAHWPPTTPFAEVVDGFPAPLLALRTCKAEMIVGLAPGVAEAAAAADPTWMVNGRRATAQAAGLRG